MAYYIKTISNRKLSYVEVKFLGIFMRVKQFLSNLYKPSLTYIFVIVFSGLGSITVSSYTT